MARSVDQALVDRARAAGVRRDAAERAVQVAAADHRAAIRQLHDTGVSLREIALLLDLSHQRIHQLVTSGRRRRSPGAAECSFCGCSEQQCGHLLTGLHGRVCPSCVARASRPGRIDESPLAPTFYVEAPKRGRSCSFCGGTADEQGMVVTGLDGRICQPCLRHCQEIVSTP